MIKKPDYSNFFYFNPLPSWVYDLEELRIFDVNQAALDHYGYSQEEFLSFTIKDLRPPEEVPKLIKALLNTKRVEGNIYIGIFTHKKKDGTLIQMEVNGHKIDFNDRQCMLVVCQDVTEQKQKELQKELLADISLDFSSASDLFSATKALCKTMCEYGQFDFAELWLPNIENTLVQLSAKISTSIQAKNFYDSCENVRSFKPGEGLSGAVWAKKSKLLWKGINKKSGFVRQKAAEKAGIQTALGIPLRFNDQIVGVLLIGTQNKANYLETYFQLFEELEHFIGSEINRKRLENELSHLYEAIPDIVSVGDFKGRFLRINQAGCELLGYEKEEILYQGFEEFIHPNDLHIAYKELERLEAGERNFGFEVRFLTKSGEILWLSWYCKVNINEGLIYCSAKDITQEKKLSQLNKQASDLAKVGSWEYDLIEDDLFWSEKVHHLHETDPNSFEPTIERAIDFYREDHKAYVKDQIYKSINEGVYLDYEAAIISTRNEERWIRVIASPEYIEQKCVNLIGSFQDITDRKEAELGVVRSEEKFRTIFDIATLGIAQVDPLTGKISLANSYYEAITGYTADELLNMSFVELTHPDDREKDWELFSKAASGEGEYRNEKRYLKKDGTIVWVRLHVAFIRDEKGKPRKTVAICEDITDRKEAESRLQTLADNLPGVVFQYHLYPDGTDALKAITKGAQEIWGFASDEVMDNNQLVWNQILLGGDMEYVQKSIHESVTSKSKWSAQWKYVMPNGELKTHLGYGSPDYLTNGTVVFNSVILDISAETKNEELLEQVSKMGKIGGWELNLKTMTPYFSDQTFQIYELPPGKAPKVEKGIHFYAKEAQPIINKAVTEAIENHTPYNLELPFITAKGNKIWVKTSGKVDVIDGKARRLYGAIQDITEQKFAEKELKSVTERLQLATEAANIGIWDWDIVRNKLIWDDKMYEIFNINPSEFKGAYEAFEAMVHPDDIQQANKDVQNAIDGVSEFDSNFRIIWKDNSIRYLHGNGLIERDINGKAIRMVGTNWDITKEKIAKEQVELALQEKNNILESIGDAFIAVDKNWGITYWNKEAENVLDRKREEIVGKNLWDVYADATDSDFYRHYYKAMETGEDVEFEEYYPTVNKWFTVSAYPSPEGLSIYFKDVTFKKEADLRLVQANERFEKVTEATSDAIWDWDILNESFYRSDAIDRFFGEGTVKRLEEKEFWRDSFHQEDMNNVQESLQSALKDSSCNRWEIQYRIFNNKDKIVYVRDRALIVRNQQGEAIRMIGAMTDITERKNFEKQLIELNDSLKKHTHELELTNQELEQFAYIASHDLQEPLRMVTSFMDLLKRKYEDQLDDKALQYIGFATDAAKRMKTIILDLLDYSRAGKLNMSQVKVNTEKIVDDYKILRKKAISEKNVRLEVYYLPTVKSYTAPLTQTIHCLLDNAIKYSRKGVHPIIKIDAEDLDGFWQFKVEDNGIGIEPKFFEKIFIIFQRLHNRDEFSGSGIGLAIAKKNVESWGGTIRIESTIGEGSTFYFTIPKA